MNDLKFAFRQLLKNPGFTAVAVLTLGLGIGANTAIFSAVNAVLLPPLPYAKPEQLVRIYSEFPTFPNGGLRRLPVSAPGFPDFRRETQSLAALDILPRGFCFRPGEIDPPDLWTPLQINPADPGGRASHSFWLLGRLKPGVTPGQAQAEFDSVVKRLADTASAGGHTFHPEGHPVVSYGLQDEVVRGVKPALRMLLGAVCFVLLIACVNVANLLLARAEGRQREIAIRGALGASRRRLIVQFVTEGVVLSSLGAVIGLLLAYNGLALVKAASDASIPRSSEIGFDAPVFLFAIAICIVTGVVFGLTPLTHVIRHRVYDALKSAAASTTGTTSTQRFRHILVVSELALALMLLIGTGLMVRAFWKLQEVNAGFDPKHVMTALVALPEETYRDPQATIGFWTRLEERLKSLPGIKSAAILSGLPPAHGTVYWDTEIEGVVAAPGGPPQNIYFYQFISKDYFKTLGIRLVDGRLFDDRDASGTPNVAIVNQTMARTFWGNQSPIGRRVRPHFRDPWCTVIGVVTDVKNAGLEKPTGTELFLPLNQVKDQALGMERTLYIAVKTDAKPSAVLGTI